MDVECAFAMSADCCRKLYGDCGRHAEVQAETEAPPQTDRERALMVDQYEEESGANGTRRSGRRESGTGRLGDYEEVPRMAVARTRAAAAAAQTQVRRRPNGTTP